MGCCGSARSGQALGGQRPPRQPPPPPTPRTCRSHAGVWVGIHRDPQELVSTLRAMRRQEDINTEVGVVHDIRLQVRQEQ